MIECARELIRFFETHFGVFDCLKDDLVKGIGYAGLVSIISSYYTYDYQTERQNDLSIDVQLFLQKIADSKTTGLGFGIVSSGLATPLAYLMQNEEEIKRKTREAEVYVCFWRLQLRV